MPYLKLNTNVAIDQEESPQLLSKLSQLVAHETGKSERYVMVEISAEMIMSFGGSRDPLAYVECKSIGLSSAQTKSISSTLTQLMSDKLKIEPDRVYIEFSNCPAEFWGWNGSTFG